MSREGAILSILPPSLGEGVADGRVVVTCRFVDMKLYYDLFDRFRELHSSAHNDDYLTFAGYSMALSPTKADLVAASSLSGTAAGHEDEDAEDEESDEDEEGVDDEDDKSDEEYVDDEGDDDDWEDEDDEEEEEDDEDGEDEDEDEEEKDATTNLGFFHLWNNYIYNTAYEHALFEVHKHPALAPLLPIHSSDSDGTCIDSMRQVWSSPAIEDHMVKSVEGIPGYKKSVKIWNYPDGKKEEEMGGVGAEGSLWDVLVGRIVRRCRLKGVRFVKRACLFRSLCLCFYNQSN